MVRPEFDLFAKIEASEGARSAGTHDDLVLSRLKLPALHKLNVPANVEAGSADAAHGNIGVKPVDRFGRSIMTKSSADASGPAALRASPGESLIRRASSRVMPLFISLSEPLRSTMATSFD